MLKSASLHKGNRTSPSPQPSTLNLFTSEIALFYLRRRRLIILLDPYWPRDRTRDPRHRPPPSEGAYLPTELRDFLCANLALLGHRCGTHKVLQQLASRLLLHQQRELYRTVEEVRYRSEVVFVHVT
jgi:hypothetical protein